MKKDLKRIIGLTILVLWIIFSIVYVLYDQWSDFKSRKVSQAFQAGISQSVNSLIQESEKCEPIQVYSGDKKVELISISCLQQAGEQQQPAE